jgi:hypothetical protein
LLLSTRSLAVSTSRMAEAGDSTASNSSKGISLADILDNEAEEIGSRQLVVTEGEHVDDDENALPAKPEREGFCVECEGTSFFPHSATPGVLSTPFSWCEVDCRPKASFSLRGTAVSLTEICRPTRRATVRNMRRRLLLGMLPFPASEREPEAAHHQIPERRPTTQKAKTRGCRRPQRYPYNSFRSLPELGDGHRTGQSTGRAQWRRREQ